MIRIYCVVDNNGTLNAIHVRTHFAAKRIDDEDFSKTMTGWSQRYAISQTEFVPHILACGKIENIMREMGMADNIKCTRYLCFIPHIFNYIFSVFFCMRNAGASKAKPRKIE